MDKLYTFDDVLIVPRFSHLQSRKDVDLTTKLLSYDKSGEIEIGLPIMSANMSTITEVDMAKAMHENHAIGALHRFCSIDENVKMFLDCSKYTSGFNFVSVGIGDSEKNRTDALYQAGARNFIIDVAHGAQMQVVEMVRYIRKKYFDSVFLVVGNFATSKTINDFRDHCGNCQPDVFKVGIGPGSACTTRLKTGCGYPQLSAIEECSKEVQVIADGGIRTPGDVAKSLAAGAVMVMLGGMLAGTTECPGEVINGEKVYSGSAANGYGEGYKTSEGVVMTVPYKGSVVPILKDIEGGLRSAMTYVGASNLIEFFCKTDFVEVSSNTVLENRAHGKK